MECERFKRLLKLWYVQVQEETLAPARMVDLMEHHISECSTCLMDPDSRKDMEKIITLVLPKDKLSPPSRSNRTAKPTIDGSGPGTVVPDDANSDKSSDDVDTDNVDADNGAAIND